MPSLTDKALFRINDAIMAINQHRVMERDPKLHIGLNPLLLTMRQELKTLNAITTKGRKSHLHQLLVQDYIQEEKELREVALAYINTQP